MINDIDYYNGILLVDKEEDISSYDVIRKIKPLFPRKHKIGHAGTLDPFASGLLIILIGKATKLSNKFMSMYKEYVFKAEFGYETDTQDIEGQRIVEDDKKISEAELSKTLQKFQGRYLQEPPQYSAKKVKGRSAYKYAREGKIVKLQPKEVDVKKIELLSFDWPFLSMKAIVSSGLYIRKLVVDIAHSLDTYANTVELRRTSIGDLVIADAINSNDLNESTVMNNLIRDIDG